METKKYARIGNVRTACSTTNWTLSVLFSPVSYGTCCTDRGKSGEMAGLDPRPEVEGGIDINVHFSNRLVMTVKDAYLVGLV